jgi:uncharacterized protein (TIGR00369 family)
MSAIYANGPEELLSISQLAEISGYDFINGIFEGTYPAPPIARVLNYWLVEVEKGKVVFEGAPEFDAMNPIGTIHGGWFGTLLDSCMACAVQTMLPKGQGYTTLEYKVNIIRPLQPDGRLYRAIGEVDHVGRRTGIAHGSLIGVEDQKIYATGSTTCYIFDLK